MLEVLSLVLSTLIFSLITIIEKKNRINGASIKSNPAMYFLSVPMLILTWIFTAKFYNFNFSLEYFLYILCWTIPVAISSYLGNYLFKYKSLTEIRSLKTGFGTLIAIFLDIFYFQTMYNFLTFISIFLFFVSGYLMDREYLKKTKLNFSFGVLIIFLVALCDVFDNFLYKIGLNFQDSFFFHIIITQVILFSFFALIGMKSLVKDVKEKRILKKDIVFVSVFIYIFLIFEAYSLKHLPIAIITLKGVIPVILFAIFDLKSKQINLNKVTVFSFLLILFSLILLIV